MILFAQGNDERPGGVGPGLSFGARLALAEEIKGLTAKLATEHPKGAGAVAEAPCNLLRGQVFHEEGAQRLVLTLSRGLGFHEKSGFFC
jgi:hypothetical protein